MQEVGGYSGGSKPPLVTSGSGQRGKMRWPGSTSQMTGRDSPYLRRSAESAACCPRRRAGLLADHPPLAADLYQGPRLRNLFLSGRHATFLATT